MYVFGHLIGAWILGLFIQLYKKIKLSRLAWGLLLFGAILPDFDFFFDWFLGMSIHRTITHSLIFVLIIFFIVYLFLKPLKLERNAYFISIGVLIHVILDMFSLPGLVLFWPLGTWFSFYGVTNFPTVPILTLELLQKDWFVLLADALLGVVWISYLFLKNKLNFD